MNKLTDEKCREQFEEFATHRYGEEWMAKDEEVEGNYAVGCVNDEWEAWQEAWNKALEIALPVLDRQDQDYWIDWGGGECPVDEMTLVEVKTRRYVVGPRIALHFNWNWAAIREYMDWDIIAYRVVQQKLEDE